MRSAIIYSFLGIRSTISTFKYYSIEKILVKRIKNGTVNGNFYVIDFIVNSLWCYLD